MTAIKRNPVLEQKATVWTTTDFPCSPPEVPEAWFDSITSQGPKFVFHLPFCSMLGRLESQDHRYHLKTAGVRGVGFLVTTVVCYKKEEQLFMELEMCWPLLHYQVPPLTFVPCCGASPAKLPKNLRGLRVQTNTRQSAWRIELHQFSGVRLFSWTRRELTWVLVHVFSPLTLAESCLELAGRKPSQRHFKMIKFAEFSCFKFNEHFRLYISLSIITLTFLSDFSEKAGTVLAVKSKLGALHMVSQIFPSFRQL